jgi:hypothetical protein
MKGGNQKKNTCGIRSKLSEVKVPQAVIRLKDFY